MYWCSASFSELVSKMLLNLNPPNISQSLKFYTPKPFLFSVLILKFILKMILHLNSMAFAQKSRNLALAHV